MACGVSTALLLMLVFIPGVSHYIADMPIKDDNIASYDIQHGWLFILCFVLPVLPILTNECKKKIMSNMSKKVQILTH
jgi:hypothetical protein